MLKNLIVLVSLVWCARGDVCDAQDSTAPSVVGCTSTVTPGEDGPCAHAYMKKMSDTGCGALYRYPCYECCINDKDASICHPGWKTCGYGVLAKSVTCPAQAGVEGL